MAPYVSQLLIYPIKSCRHVQLDSARIDAFGFEFDRNWALIDPQTGKLVTCREEPKMVLVQPEIRVTGEADGKNGLERGGVMSLSAPGMEVIDVSFPHKVDDHTEKVIVDVWGDRSDALDEGDAVSAWFEKHLGRKLRLVVKDLRQVRTHSGAYDDENQPPYSSSSYPGVPSVGAAFSDCFPFLLVSAEAVREVDAKVKAKDEAARPIKAENFRPNVVVEGCEAYAEDGWMKIKIGSTEFDVLSRATRCIATCVDTELAEIQKEPLKTLQSTRRVDPNARFEACFGMWLQQHSVGGTIKIGDEVEVLSTGEHGKKKKVRKDEA